MGRSGSLHSTMHLGVDGFLASSFEAQATARAVATNAIETIRFIFSLRDGVGSVSAATPGYGCVVVVRFAYQKATLAPSTGCTAK
jgi:hypothetical protein